MKKLFLFLISIPIIFSGCRQSNIIIDSPNHYISLSFNLDHGKPGYSVSYKGKNIINYSHFKLLFQGNGLLGENIKILSASSSDGTEDYDLVVGKSKHVSDAYREVMIKMAETVSPFRKLNFEVKMFNNAVAFRYVIPEQDNWHSFSLQEENTKFIVAGDPGILTLFLPNYTTSHEGEFSSLLFHEIKNDTLMDLPTLFEFPGKVFMAITEANLHDYAGMYLIKKSDTLQSILSPLPETPGIKVKANLPHSSPWRVLLISDRVGSILESNVITSLNEPCKIKDLSWIKPGKITWPWWNGDIIPDSIKGGNNFETNKYYIDFCARHGIEYHSVVEYGGHEWYVNDGEGFSPGPHVDVTKTVPGLDMKKICDYAEQKGVGIRVWVHFGALYPKLDAAFDQFEKWGLKGLMVDFMDRDDQEMVNMQEEILQKAAAHKLHIQFHGAYKPTGLWRTYPNELTREGVMNYEYDKWGKVTPDHDINAVFTRMIAGPTDYHMGGFRAVPDSLFKIQNERPLVLGTRSHMLAMYVVLENYLNMVADYPAAYEGQSGFEFVEKVPTTWDETRVLNAVVSNYITIARRKGNDWYVGTITNHKGRSVTFNFNFLSEGEYNLTLYKDAVDVRSNPNHLDKQESIVLRTDSLTIKLAPGGGAALQFTKK